MKRTPMQVSLSSPPAGGDEARSGGRRRISSRGYVGPGPASRRRSSLNSSPSGGPAAPARLSLRASEEEDMSPTAVQRRPKISGSFSEKKLPEEQKQHGGANGVGTAAFKEVFGETSSNQAGTTSAKDLLPPSTKQAEKGDSTKKDCEGSRDDDFRFEYLDPLHLNNCSDQRDTRSLSSSSTSSNSKNASPTLDHKPATGAVGLALSSSSSLLVGKPQLAGTVGKKPPGGPVIAGTTSSASATGRPPPKKKPILPLREKRLRACARKVYKKVKDPAEYARLAIRYGEELLNPADDDGNRKTTPKASGSAASTPKLSAFDAARQQPLSPWLGHTFSGPLATIQEDESEDFSQYPILKKRVLMSSPKRKKKAAFAKREVKPDSEAVTETVQPGGAAGENRTKFAVLLKKKSSGSGKKKKKKKSAMFHVGTAKKLNVRKKGVRKEAGVAVNNSKDDDSTTIEQPAKQDVGQQQQELSSLKSGGAARATTNAMANYAMSKSVPASNGGVFSGVIGFSGVNSGNTSLLSDPSSSSSSSTGSRSTSYNNRLGSGIGVVAQAKSSSSSSSSSTAKQTPAFQTPFMVPTTTARHVMHQQSGILSSLESSSASSSGMFLAPRSSPRPMEQPGSGAVRQGPPALVRPQIITQSTTRSGLVRTRTLPKSSRTTKSTVATSVFNISRMVPSVHQQAVTQQAATTLPFASGSGAATSLEGLGWVECTHCGSWRKVYGTLVAIVESLPEDTQFVCKYLHGCGCNIQCDEAGGDGLQIKPRILSKEGFQYLASLGCDLRPLFPT
ncbi:unnamed protein product [Amoebophrya sp. A25]|nr:unnamed protein product [Amoebophrya sp. A25]|eukprot:GSA25T00005242001.1